MLTVDDISPVETISSGAGCDRLIRGPLDGWYVDTDDADYLRGPYDTAVEALAATGRIGTDFPLTVVEAHIFWAVSDGYERWAYRVDFLDGRSAAGRWAGPLSYFASQSEIIDAVVELAHIHGRAIVADDCVFDDRAGAAFAGWAQ